MRKAVVFDCQFMVKANNGSYIPSTQERKAQTSAGRFEGVGVTCWCGVGGGSPKHQGAARVHY